MALGEVWIRRRKICRTLTTLMMGEVHKRSCLLGHAGSCAVGEKGRKKAGAGLGQLHPAVGIQTARRSALEVVDGVAGPIDQQRW